MGAEEEHLQRRIDAAVREKIELVPFDPAWAKLFADEAEFLRNTFRAAVIIRIEHFGSTAVPGLSAKPIVDILVEVASLDEARTTIAPVLESAGYEYFWRTDVPTPYAWFIKRDAKGNRTHHLHFVENDSAMWERLYFRDYLRDFPDEARRYERLKRELSMRFPDDRIAYTRGKTEFILKVTNKALKHYGENL